MEELLNLNAFLGMPSDISTHGHELDYMNNLVHWLMFILFVGWGVYFIYVLIRFREKKNPKANYEGVKSHYSTYAEAGVVLAEVVLLFAFAIPTWAVIKNDFPAAEEALEIHAVGEQFKWNFHHPGPDGIFGRRDVQFIDTQFNPLGLDEQGDPNAADDIVLPSLYIPVDTPIIVNITSKDVIHSFALLNLRVKQDAIPGLEIPVWFEATETGRYIIGCAQLCGIGHSTMNSWMYIQSQEEFAAWVAEESALQKQDRGL